MDTDMIFKSGLITQGSGSIGGLTASRNKGGNYLKARSNPVDPGSAAQVAQRARIQLFSANWTDVLTAAQRLAWNDWAETQSRVNSLGDTIQVSGQNLYIAGNSLLAQAGGAAVTAAPIETAQPPTDIIFGSVDTTNDFNCLVDAGGNPWAAEDDSFLLVFASTNVSKGRTFFKGPFAFIASLEGDITTPVTGAQTIAGGPTLVAGDNVWVRFRVVTIDGRTSASEIQGPFLVS